MKSIFKGSKKWIAGSILDFKCSDRCLGSIKMWVIRSLGRKIGTHVLFNNVRKSMFYLFGTLRTSCLYFLNSSFLKKTNENQIKWSTIYNTPGFNKIEFGFKLHFFLHLI